jgi:hypothetical protein
LSDKILLGRRECLAFVQAKMKEDQQEQSEAFVADLVADRV